MAPFSTYVKKSGLPLNVGAISLANTLNHVQTASRIRSVSDAQNLIDFLHAIIQTNQGMLVWCLPIAWLTNYHCHLAQRDRNLSWRVAQLVLEIYPRISV